MTEEEKDENIVDIGVDRLIPNDMPEEQLYRLAKRLSKEKALDIRKHGRCKFVRDRTSKKRSHNKGGRKNGRANPEVCGKHCIGDRCFRHKVTREPGVIINKEMVAKSKEKESEKGKRSPIKTKHTQIEDVLGYQWEEFRKTRKLVQSQAKEIAAMKKEICDLKIMLDRKMDKKKK